MYYNVIVDLLNLICTYCVLPFVITLINLASICVTWTTCPAPAWYFDHCSLHPLVVSLLICHYSHTLIYLYTCSYVCPVSPMRTPKCQSRLKGLGPSILNDDDDDDCILKPGKSKTFNKFTQYFTLPIDGSPTYSVSAGEWSNSVTVSVFLELVILSNTNIIVVCHV